MRLEALVGGGENSRPILRLMTELVATLPGQRLYRTFGYVGEERVEYPLAAGLTIAFVPMRKSLGASDG